MNNQAIKLPPISFLDNQKEKPVENNDTFHLPSISALTSGIAKMPSQQQQIPSQQHHFHHNKEDLGEQIREAQSQLKEGGHIHIVHEPHGDHHHHKVYVHNPKEETTVDANDTTVVDNSATITMNQSIQTIGEETTTAQADEAAIHSPISVSNQVVKSAAQFPRRTLGSIVYNDYPTYDNVTRYLDLDAADEARIAEERKQWEAAQKERAALGFFEPARIELLPAAVSNYINCLVDVLVPCSAVYENPNVLDKRVWGTDVYTDDSDVVAMLYHCGVLHSRDPTKRGVRPKDRLSRRQQREETRDAVFKEDGEYEFSRFTGPLTPGNLDNMHNVVYGREEEEDEEADLVVTLVILPKLREYKGCFRNNYSSRSWTDHDGVSVAIHGVRWCRVGEGVHYAGVSHHGSFRKRLMREQMAVTKRARQQDKVVAGWKSRGAKEE